MDDDVKAKILEAIVPSVKEYGYALADMVVAFSKATGASLSEMTELDLLVLGTNLERGALEASGLKNYVKFETSASDAAAKFAATCQDPERAINALKYARYEDMVMTKMKHFSSRDTVIAQACEMKEGDECQFAASKTLEPVSPEAKRWARELASPLHYLPASSSAIQPVTTTGKEVPCESELLAIRAKATITETEAAKLLSMSPKALGNLRRINKIPRNIYMQNNKKGKVLYNTAAVLEWGNGNIPKRIRK